METASKHRYAPEEYLARERKAAHRSAYFAGEVFAMGGASRTHNLIAANLVAGLHGQLRGRPCELYASDMRVKVDATGLYTYPDVVVVCGEPAFEDEHVDTLLNPTVLVEILSDSTEGYDRGKKFEHYRKLGSLQEYVLVSQKEVHVERFRRQASGEWLLSEASGPAGVVELESIGCTLDLGEVFDKVDFEA